MRLSPALLEAVDVVRAGVPRERFVRQLLEDAVAAAGALEAAGVAAPPVGGDAASPPPSRGRRLAAVSGGMPRHDRLCRCVACEYMRKGG